MSKKSIALIVVAIAAAIAGGVFVWFKIRD